MLVPSRLTHPLARWLFSIGAVVAVAAQLSIALAPLGEAQEGRSAAAHVEAGGTATHYAHNDATCAACQARSLQGIAARVPAPLLGRATLTTAFVASSERLNAADLLSHNTPRAPPRWI
jgi:hypothetical protein